MLGAIASLTENEKEPRTYSRAIKVTASLWVRYESRDHAATASICFDGNP